MDSCSSCKDDHGRKGPGRGDFRHQLGREWFGSKWCFRAVDRCHLGPVSHLRDSRRLDLLDLECNLHPGVAWTIHLYAIPSSSSCEVISGRLDCTEPAETSQHFNSVNLQTFGTCRGLESAAT